MSLAVCHPNRNRQSASAKRAIARAEYATENNQGSVCRSTSSATLRAIMGVNGMSYCPELEDAILTGKATKTFGDSRRSVMPVFARHKSHGGFYANGGGVIVVKTRSRLSEPTQRDIDAADAFACEHDKVCA